MAKLQLKTPKKVTLAIGSRNEILVSHSMTEWFRSSEFCFLILNLEIQNLILSDIKNADQEIDDGDRQFRQFNLINSS